MYVRNSAAKCDTGVGVICPIYHCYVVSSKRLGIITMYKIIFQKFLLPTYPIFFRHVIGNRQFLFGLTT